MKQFFAGLLSLIFILVSLPFAFIGHISYRYLSSDFYKNHIESTIQPVIADQLSAVLFKQEPSLSLLITPDQLEQLIITDLITATFLGDSIENLFQQIKQFEKGDNVILPLTLLKQNIPQFVEKLLLTIEPKIEKCGPKKVSTNNDDIQEVQLCIPPQVTREEFLNQFMITLSADVLSYVPEEAKLSTEETENYIILLHDAITFKPHLFTIMIAIATLLLLMIGLIVLKPWISILKWEFSTLFTSSINLIVIAYGITLIPSILKRSVSLLKPEQIMIAQTLSEASSHDIYFIGGILAFFAGILLLILSGIFIRKHLQKNLEQNN